MVDYSLLRTTILLLVSDPIVRSVLKETLECKGYTVVAAGDLGQAVDRLRDFAPDLLITRNYVQGLPGHDAAVYLRTKCLKMRVLMAVAPTSRGCLRQPRNDPQRGGRISRCGRHMPAPDHGEKAILSGRGTRLGRS